MSQRRMSNTYALAFARALPALTDVAREHGYCLAVHGSMATDFDLVAIPWVNEADEPETLIEAIRECIGGRIHLTPADGPKPHGRLAWTILPNDLRGLPRLDLVPWLDISVMPRLFCTCPGDRETAPPVSTRRPICKCGLNHYFCDACGRQLGPCRKIVTATADASSPDATNP
jgi:hypothetical protein